MIDYRASEGDKSQPALFLCSPFPPFSPYNQPHLVHTHLSSKHYTVLLNEKKMKIFLFLLGLLLSREAVAAPAPVKALVSRQESGDTTPPHGSSCGAPVCA
ncbi:hypothetical protein PGT21_004132 [Puccinia graminis f. sp. tritici]|uniref:Uncharacterized protein n=1 Tax=Puccinia graminis f. sp. tritici TaxID=56615 RepID=A0A5B0S8T4_PUCGR|nr:hypothetical protein PGT21_004132 [Puccinia graminis f. sp. tritici]KAA1134288.1 hypothetical protein PGTUg99_034651 [Puccinia graminis f. sp. tritici]